MNIIEVIGYVGNDPEERVTPSGRKVVNFRLADNVKVADREETLWWRISCWGEQFDRVLPYIKKGTALIVHGEIRRKPETYQDREGHTNVSLELTAVHIRFMPVSVRGERQSNGSDEARSTSAPSYSPSAPSSVPGGFRPGSGADEFSEDNLPF